jgi:hypothetical protein
MITASWIDGKAMCAAVPSSASNPTSMTGPSICEMRPTIFLCAKSFVIISLSVFLTVIMRNGANKRSETAKLKINLFDRAKKMLKLVKIGKKNVKMRKKAYICNRMFYPPYV